MVKVSAVLERVAIVGAGSLGRRHLQGLVKSTRQILIYVVEPLEESRKAVEEFIASEGAASLPSISVHSCVEELSGDLDLVIVATTSSVRLQVIERLTSVCRVRYMVLEKFLFHDSQEYRQAESLIKEHGAIVWVNTPRRSFDIYRQLRDRTRNDRLVHFSADGGDWGLCGNSVHFVDLVQFLSGETELRRLHSRFDDLVLCSKRVGYIELAGELGGEVGSTTFSLRSIRDSVKPVTLTLQYEKSTIFLIEGFGTLWHVDSRGLEKKNFRIPYQSEITGVIADQVLATGTCDLTPYLDSMNAHLPLLNLFAHKAGEVFSSRSVCKVT